MSDMSVKDRIKYELGQLKRDADANKIEAFFCVRIDRSAELKRLVPTVTVIAPDTATREQVDLFFGRLHEFATILNDVIEPEKR